MKNAWRIPRPDSRDLATAPVKIRLEQFDPLRDEGEAYGVWLRQARVPVTCTRYDGAIRGLVSLSNVAEIGKRRADRRRAADCVRARPALPDGL